MFTRFIEMSCMFAIFGCIFLIAYAMMWGILILLRIVDSILGTKYVKRIHEWINR